MVVDRSRALADEQDAHVRIVPVPKLDLMEGKGALTILEHKVRDTLRSLPLLDLRRR